jgi:hypothetical protein
VIHCAAFMAMVLPKDEAIASVRTKLGTCLHAIGAIYTAGLDIFWLAVITL